MIAHQVATLAEQVLEAELRPDFCDLYGLEPRHVRMIVLGEIAEIEREFGATQFPGVEWL